jgi:prevent-host-death family protein
METVNASYFKTHFGEILGKATRRPVRITRRGGEASVLLTEADYEQLRQRAARPAAEESEALLRLQRLSKRTPDLKHLENDIRAQAIVSKHAKGIKG